MTEALTLINRLLYENEVQFNGQFYHADGVTLTPKPLQQPIPTYMATSTRETVLAAAHHGYGIMAGPPFPLAQVRDSLATYQDLDGPTQNPNLILIRFYHVAPTETRALGEARMLLKAFAERMQVTTAQLQPAWSTWFDIDRLIADSLIGTPDMIAAKAKKIGRDLAPRSLILKQIRSEMAERAQDLSLFMRKIQPDLLAA
jgi:alkanesulfonate monooxygenase SsuD/methylene tetrahydromethanopterin reductase-like flavin-dependent oxidoreductase (luciferase family)